MKKTKKKWTGSHGSVTVFLSLVLVPCLLFTCVFGDVSRVQLSKMTTTSAADLSLEALLGQYDPDLKEWYGLVASCQDIDQFFDVSEKYFTGMISSAGLPDQSSELFSEYLRGVYEQYQGEKASDLLQVEPVGEIVVGNVGGPGNNSLRNPALLQKSIVEFMKYRGPVGLTTKLLEKVKGQSITVIRKNKKTSDAKQDYAKKESDLMEALFRTYRALVIYDEAKEESGCPNYTSFRKQDMSEVQKSIYANLEDATELIVMYYFKDSDDLKPLSVPSLDENSVGPFEKSDVATQGDETETFYLSDSQFKKLIKNVEKDAQKVTSAIETQNQKWETVKGQRGTNYNPVVAYLDYQKASTEVDKIEKKMLGLLEKKAKIKVAKGCEAAEKNGPPSDWLSQLDNAVTKIDEAYAKYAQYGLVAQREAALMSEVYSKVKDRTYKKNENNLDTLIKGLDTLALFYNNLKVQEENLNCIIDGGDIGDYWVWTHAPALDSLLTKVEKFTTSKEQWADTMRTDRTAYQEQEWTEYSGENGTEEQTKKAVENVTAESVGELKTRLVNIRKDVQTCIHAIENFTFCGKQVISLCDGKQVPRDELIKLVRKKIPDKSSISKDQNKIDASNTYSANITPGWKEAAAFAVLREDGAKGNNPDLKVNSPQLYTFLMERFRNEEQEIKDALKKKKEFEKNSEKQKEEKKKNGAKALKFDEMGGDVPDQTQGDAVSITDSIDSLLGVIEDLCRGPEGLADQRDRLYVVEYMMDMFSWYSFNDEGKYKLEDADKDKWGQDQKDSIYGDQSLTNRAISKTNNQAMLGEIEYILYGGTTNEAVATAAGNILAVRMALDTAAGFQLYYSGKNNTAMTINSIANSIQSLSQGVVPVPITKVLIIGALSVLEAAKDVETLVKGEPVPFYKNEDENWFFSLLGGGGNFPDMDSQKPREGQKADKETGWYYSDYMYIFLLLGMNNDSTQIAMLNRTGDLIQANMRKGGHEGYDLGKARTHFQLEATLRVKPLMMTLPLVDNTSPEGVALRNSTDWCTYKLKVIRGYS